MGLQGVCKIKIVMNSVKHFLLLLVLSGLLIVGCGPMGKKNSIKNDKSLASVPAWAKEAIWYQIFVERFRNGDPSNDPTPADMAGSYPDKLPANWKITPWGHDWYSHEPWLDSVKAKGFHSKIQARRYGGDLQGVLDKIDYIQSLGVTAIFFNPLNDSPSLHKYDARNYTHIDRNFGPDPKGDAAIMETEIHDDPSTWKWTSADKLFLKVVDEFHKRGIRVIMDYSWNHTGKTFWALDDIRKKGKDSKYVDWYTITQFEDPSKPGHILKYEGWGGNNPYMPVLKKDIIPPDDKIMPFEGNFHSESLKKHIFDVTRRWLDPNSDGNPADGVDGFRLDVAGEIPMGFWREYRKIVRSVNPKAYLVGEIWWLEWPDKLLNPKVFLEGDQYDAIMNYRWFRIARGFFGQAEPVLTPTGFVKEIKRINRGINPENLQAMMNVASTHDSPRLSTSLYNKTMDKYKAKPSDNPDYKINKPDSLTRKEQILLLIHQFTFLGAPQIWNGEEVGMWGADDPDCRKPMVWNDIIYEDERAAYDPAKNRSVDQVSPDTVFRSFYNKLCKMRKENPVLVYGSLTFSLADDQNMLLSYSRMIGNDEIVVVFNRSSKRKSVKVPVNSNGEYLTLLTEKPETYLSNSSRVEINLEPLSAVVLKKK
jgi:cyclomaltodextrinase / maltogenic alpha-amylase / neopullulanase